MANSTPYDLVIFAHQPNTIRQYRAYCLVMRAFGRLLPLGWRDPIPRPLGGHYGRTRSLVCGLEQLDVRFAYAPRLAQVTARAAIVLAGVEELKTAIAWRCRGGCDLLLAGPNIVELPHHQNGILLSPEIDQIVVASDKVRQYYERIAPQLAGRVCVWPAGIDEKYWHARGDKTERTTVLIYNKRMNQLASQLDTYLTAHGFRCEVIQYGERRRERYRPYQFRSALNNAYACVMLTLNETQGLAAAEAWSMDVPTLAYRAPDRENIQTLPYLNSAVGAYWSSTDQLVQLLHNVHTANFRPRDWLLTNMTDAVCAAKLMALVEKLRVAG
jgi:hypothetical protein